MGFIITIVIIMVLWTGLRFLWHWGKMNYALDTLGRLLDAYGRGQISKIQVNVMMKEMEDPHDILAVKGVSDWLDSIDA